MRYRTVLTLGAAQTLAWASSYYLLAILASPMARALDVSAATVFGAFSLGLVVSALLGPRAGRAIDRWGGRPVLATSNLVFAAALALMAWSDRPATLYAAWALMGVAMAGGLYESAFAALVRLYGSNSRNAITGITLLAGFASTVSWPLSTALEAAVGWRGACLGWAALHLLIGLPLNLSLPRATAARPAHHPAEQGGSTQVQAVPMRSAVLLSSVFALTWFISTAMAAHLPALLQASGVSLAVAITAGALLGPAQVAGRLLEYGVLQRVHPLWSARVAGLMHPVAALALAVVGAPAALFYAVLHGAGNGVLTIAKGTLPLALFGPQGYGERQGWLMVPARLAQALAPWLFGLCLDHWGARAVLVSGGLGLLVFLALCALRVRD